jgi:hypothetical protein
LIEIVRAPVVGLVNVSHKAASGADRRVTRWRQALVLLRRPPRQRFVPNVTLHLPGKPAGEQGQIAIPRCRLSGLISGEGPACRPGAFRLRPGSDGSVRWSLATTRMIADVQLLSENQILCVQTGRTDSFVARTALDGRILWQQELDAGPGAPICRRLPGGNLFLFT